MSYRAGRRRQAPRPGDPQPPDHETRRDDACDHRRRRAVHRLPTSCATASSTATVVTSDGLTGSGQSSFVPTGCHLLAYAPSLTAVGVGEEPDRDGVDLTVVLTQPRAATESATRQLILDLPPTVVPIAGAVAACLNGTSCVIGSVTATARMLASAKRGRLSVRATATLKGGRTAQRVITLQRGSRAR